VVSPPAPVWRPGCWCSALLLPNRVERDPRVLDRIAGWGWTEGLKPAPTAPVWGMDRFRDRFMTAYGPGR
jgi:hypothetical protein